MSSARLEVLAAPGALFSSIVPRHAKTCKFECIYLSNFPLGTPGYSSPRFSSLCSCTGSELPGVRPANMLTQHPP